MNTDEYEHCDSIIEYIVENVLQHCREESVEFEQLEYNFQISLDNGCGCTNLCDEKCIHAGNYEIKNNKLLLRNDRRCRDLIYECNENCLCDASTCENRLVQFGPIKNLEVIKTNNKGFALITKQFIEKGSFICEYSGEILTKSEAMRRDGENLRNNRMNYIFCLNEINEDNHEKKNKIQTFIDPSRKGNIGRYINHSCDPNCEIISVRVDSVIPKISIFSQRDIHVNEEITFSYGSSAENGSVKECFCNSQNCNMYLPNISFQ
jgi:histone-lysine N-methyltransferase SETMAR